MSAILAWETDIEDGGQFKTTVMTYEGGADDSVNFNVSYFGTDLGFDLTPREARALAADLRAAALNCEKGKVKK